MLFNFEKEFILENDSVLLRPLKYTDFDALVPFAFHEPEIWKYSIDAVANEENFKKYFEKALLGYEQKKEYPFIVFDKIKNVYAGSTRFYNIQLNNASVMLGYTWYGKEFQGTKLNKNCKYLLLEFIFEYIGLNRVGFEANNKNARNIAAMKSIGCSVEGILREAVINHDGSKRDTILLSILKKDWVNGIKSNLHSKIYNKI